jgi:hypothetical protein
MFLILFVLLKVVESLDRHNFNNPNSCDFYNSNKEFNGGSKFTLISSQIQIENYSVKGKILNIIDDVLLNYTLVFFENGIVRFTVEENSSFYPRMKLDDYVMINKLKKVQIKCVKNSDNLEVFYGDYKLKLTFSSILIEVFDRNGILFLEINKKSQFNFEHYPSAFPPPSSSEPYSPGRGESQRSVALDVSFSDADYVYGLI